MTECVTKYNGRVLGISRLASLPRVDESMFIANIMFKVVNIIWHMDETPWVEIIVTKG